MTCLSVETVKRWLAEIPKAEDHSDRTRKWEALEELASDLFSSSEFTCQDKRADKALLAYAQCRALSNLNRFSLALQPGQIASYLAEEAGDYDLLARSLDELAYVQGQLPGREREAIESLRKFLRYADRCSEEVKRLITPLVFNLAVVERTCNKHDDALNHFQQAWQTSVEQQDEENAEVYRRNYCWEAMTCGQMDLALKLIGYGERYVAKHSSPGAKSQQIKRAECQLFLHKSRYALLTGDYATAASLAIQAIPEAASDDVSDTMAIALHLLSVATEKVGDHETALGVGLLAYVEAQLSGRTEWVMEIRRHLRSVRFQDRNAVDRLMARLLRPA